jgi:hypothetical protein
MRTRQTRRFGSGVFNILPQDRRDVSDQGWTVRRISLLS